MFSFFSLLSFFRDKKNKLRANSKTTPSFLDA